jgi:hypothetical protein
MSPTNNYDCEVERIIFITRYEGTTEVIHKHYGTFCGENQCCGSGSGAFLTPKSGMGKKSGSGSGINNPDHISDCLKNNFLVNIPYLPVLFDVDPGWKKIVSGMKKNRIRDKHQRIRNTG